MIVFLPELQNINLICQDARCRMKQIHLTKKKNYFQRKYSRLQTHRQLI